MADRQAQPYIFGGADFYDHDRAHRAATSSSPSAIHGGSPSRNPHLHHPGTSPSSPSSSSSGSSPPDEEFNMWYSQMMRGTHGTPSTHSETYSEGRSATSPSGLTAGSSVGTAEDADEDSVMTDAPGILPEPPHEDIWPQVSSSDIPPRDPAIQDNDDPLHLAAEDQMLLPHPKLPAPVLDPTTQSTTAPSSTRPRKLPSPEKTSKVRGMGACLQCRVAKTPCAPTPHEPCKQCEKACGKWQGPDAGDICIRKTPYSIVGPLSSRRWCLDADSPRPRFGNKVVTILLSFTKDTSGPFLSIQAHELEGQQKFGILPEQNPRLEEDMFQWAKKRIQSDPDSGFEAGLDRFLMALDQHHGIEMASKREPNRDDGSNFVGSQKDCVRKLLKMKCMWKIWSCNKLHFRQQRAQPGMAMSESAPLQPVQQYLRQLAGQAVSEAEKAVLKEVDKLLTQNAIKEKSHLVLWPALNVVAWTSLWQLILIYRSTLSMFPEEQIGMTPISTNFHSAKRTEFLAITGELYKNVAVLCSGAFRTKRVLSSLEETGSEVFKREPFRFPEVWQAHYAFYQSFRVMSPGDDFVKLLVIGKEVTVLGRKRPSKK